MTRIIEPRSPMSAGEVALILGVDPKTVTRWAKAGRISYFWTPGGHRRYQASDVERFLRPGAPDDRSSMAPDGGDQR